MAANSVKIGGHDQAVLASIFNPNLPFEPAIEDEENLVEAQSTKLVGDSECVRLDKEGIEAAEEGNYVVAQAKFNASIDIDGSRPSVFNNRAQLSQLQGNVEDAKLDLDKAIKLSDGAGAAACQAFTQRAMIRRLQGDDTGCREDFQKAADLGSNFAKQQLVALNPYAALCNSMLKEMIFKVQRGEPTDAGDPAA